MQLPAAGALRPPDLAGAGATRGLVAADAGRPGVVGLERADERLDLADFPAPGGGALPQVRAFPAVLLGDGDHLGSNEAHGVALEQEVARFVALPKEEVRVE